MQEKRQERAAWRGPQLGQRLDKAILGREEKAMRSGVGKGHSWKWDEERVEA